MLPIPSLGHLPVAITPDKVEMYPEKRGGYGDPPMSCFPLKGERGVNSLNLNRE
jgi:hypothetical protein